MKEKGVEKPGRCACSRQGVVKKNNNWVCEKCHGFELRGVRGGPTGEVETRSSRQRAAKKAAVPALERMHD